MKGLMVYCDEKGSELKTISLLKLPLKEKVIIDESIRIYDEEEPCIIYRTAIINRTGLTLLPKLEKLNIENHLLDLEEVKKIIGDILDVPEIVKKIRFV